MQEIWLGLKSFIPTSIVVVVFVLVFVVIQKLLKRQGRGKSDWKIIRQIILFSIITIGFIAFILTLPMSDTMRGQITQLLGIVISAVIALSSATLIGNMFAGILLRIIGSFKPGDFIQIDEYFGRVSERSLFHTEVQTVDSDLITLPNLFLATNVVKVKRSTGTFIYASVSLGYDVSRNAIEECLIRAAEKAGLEDNYVSILSLDDYSVVYEIHGKLMDIKKIISKRSLLRAMMLDELHQAKIEIVSPTFMNQRQIGERHFIPKKPTQTEGDKQVTAQPEDQIFDKAEAAEHIEKRKKRLDELDDRIKQLQAQMKDAKDENDKASFQEKIDKCKVLQEKILTNIEAARDQLEKGK